MLHLQGDLSVPRLVLASSIAALLLDLELDVLLLLLKRLLLLGSDLVVEVTIVDVVVGALEILDLVGPEAAEGGGGVGGDGGVGGLGAEELDGVGLGGERDVVVDVEAVELVLLLLLAGEEVGAVEVLEVVAEDVLGDQGFLGEDCSLLEGCVRG